MRSLPPLGDPPGRFFLDIAGQKRKGADTRLNDIASRVLNAYQYYDDNSTALEKIQSGLFSIQEADDLKDCYTKPTKALNKLKADIRRHHARHARAAASVCQYCGINPGTSTFDHYLPKETFPEFSTLSLNLVPCCGECNGLKLQAWVDALGRREIFSLYFDRLPTTTYLSARLSIAPEPFAVFRLSDDPSDFDGLEDSVRSHYRTLDLLDRFSRAAPMHFTEIRHILRMDGIESALASLKMKVVAFTADQSPNFWQVALYKAMIADPVFLIDLALTN